MGITGDALLTFVNGELFPALKSLQPTGKSGDRRRVVRDVFEDADNYMKSGQLMRQVINKINGIDFNSPVDRQHFGEIYEQLLNDLQSAGNAGEYDTPRAVTAFMVDWIDPRPGEILVDPACGTGGFLSCAIRHMEKNLVRTTKQRDAMQAGLRAVEKSACRGGRPRRSGSAVGGTRRRRARHREPARPAEGHPRRGAGSMNAERMLKHYERNAMFAAAIVNGRRGIDRVYVFTFRGRPITRMLTSAWKRARQRVGLPHVRVHDLKHTFGRRLRAAGVNFEDRQDLLGHRSGRVTTHYSAAELARLLEAAESVTEIIGERPELVVLRGKLGTVLPQNSRKRSTGA